MIRIGPMHGFFAAMIMIVQHEIAVVWLNLPTAGEHIVEFLKGVVVFQIHPEAVGDSNSIAEPEFGTCTSLGGQYGVVDIHRIGGHRSSTVITECSGEPRD